MSPKDAIIKQCTSVLGQIIEDSSVPRNIRRAAEEARTVLFDTNTSPVVRAIRVPLYQVRKEMVKVPLYSHICYAGLSGKVFVKLLEEIWTGVSPTAAYWNPTRVVTDTRLGAFESDVGEFLFMAPDSGDVRIEAVLLYRRAYKKLMDLKGWKEPDIVMESAAVSISQKH